MKELSRKILRSAVFWNYLTVALRSGAAVFILPLILRKMPSEEVGLWYLFGSIAGLAWLLDLGFGSALNRSTSYLWAGATKLLPMGLEKIESGNSTGGASLEPNYELLSRLIATMRHFYFCLGAVLFVVLELGGGAWIWMKTADLPNAESLRWAWAFFAFGCALNTVGNFWPSLLTGINGVRESQKVFLIALILNYTIALIGLLAGAGLWALAAGQVVMGMVNRLLGRHYFLRLSAGKLNYSHIRPDLNLLKILWPTSWRLAAITVGLYWLIQANTMLTSLFLDLKVTAAYGLSLQVVLFLSQITCILVLVKMPLISQLRGKHALEEIRMIFVSRVRLFLLGYLAGMIGIFWVGDWLLTNVVSAKTHLLPRPQLLLLLVVIGLEAHTALYRELVQTANVNPFVKPILFSALSSVVMVMVMTPYWGIWGVLIAPGLAQLVYNNWWIVKEGIRSLDMSGKEFLTRLVRFQS